MFHQDFYFFQRKVAIISMLLLFLTMLLLSHTLCMQCVFRNHLSNCPQPVQKSRIATLTDVRSTISCSHHCASAPSCKFIAVLNDVCVLLRESGAEKSNGKGKWKILKKVSNLSLLVQQLNKNFLFQRIFFKYLLKHSQTEIFQLYLQGHWN